MLKIADISSNNPRESVPGIISSCDGVIVKATEGKGYRNPYMPADASSVMSVGRKCLGIYHYARPEKNTAEEEALYFLYSARHYIGEAVLALDWEGAALQCSPTWAREWLDIVYSITGVRPLIYCSESAIPAIGAAVQPGGYGLWVAKYSTKIPQISPWKIKALWQYTASPYDLSLFYGTTSAWKKYAEREKK